VQQRGYRHYATRPRQALRRRFSGQLPELRARLGWGQGDRGGGAARAGRAELRRYGGLENLERRARDPEDRLRDALRRLRPPGEG
jgi:hypothetical protein